MKRDPKGAMMRGVRVGGVEIGAGRPLALIAGPCVIENEGLTTEIACALQEICARAVMPLIFKASFDKANRSSIGSYRGPGLAQGLKVLEAIRGRTGLPVCSDVHEAWQAREAAAVLDLLQIPAFLCRQTDLLVAAGETGRPVNVKKGQFLAAGDMRHVVDKIRSTGNDQILLTERGTSFGYHNLVVDMRGLAIMRGLGRPVIFDATHSVQLPGAGGTASSGEREFIPVMARAAVAAGVDGLFLEVHPDPDAAPSDGPNMVPLRDLPDLLEQVRAVDASVARWKEGPPGP